MDEALSVEHARILRSSREAALCFLDLDCFKQINTDHGYFAADQLLIAVYQRLRERLRASDQIFRWGGEEFVILAPDQADLAGVAERLRRLIAAEPFVIEGGEITVTASIGAALLDETRAPEVVLKVASRLMTIAKVTRDTVEVEPTEARQTARIRSLPHTASP
jgi:diguanylate cyclase (GGDEF)-like protein